MEELIKLLKSREVKWIGSVTSVIILVYLGSTIVKSYVEMHRNLLQGKVYKMQIIEYKKKYSDIMQDTGANTNIEVKEGSQII